MEKLYRIKESTLRNLTESVKNITGKTEEVIVVGNISNEINYKVEELDNEIVAQTTLISEQDNKIAELAEILSGKAGGSGGCGTSIDDIGIFTISGVDDYCFLFIKGMTFSEYVSSKMNIKYGRSVYIEKSINGYMVQYSFDSMTSVYGALATDASNSLSLIADNTPVEERQYYVQDIAPF